MARARQLGWFVGNWAASVLVLGLVGLLIKQNLHS